MRAAVERAVGQRQAAGDGERCLSPRAKRVLEQAVGKATSLGHGCVSTQHLLLGILCGRDGLGVRAIRDVGTTLERVRSDVLRDVARGPGG